MFPLFLFAQLLILLVALGFLIKTRNLITPLNNWLSFVLRCILWLLLTIDQLLQIYHSDLFSPHVAAVCQAAIVSMLLYSAWARVKFQRAERVRERAYQERIEALEALYRAGAKGEIVKAQAHIARLEEMRERDELVNVGYSWNYLPHMPRIETVYRMKAGK